VKKKKKKGRTTPKKTEELPGTKNRGKKTHAKRREKNYKESLLKDRIKTKQKEKTAPKTLSKKHNHSTITIM